MHRRLLFIASSALIIFAAGSPARAQSTAPHPLEIHMAHQLVGSGEWRSSNPEYSPGDQRRPREFGVSWAWGPNRQHLIGNVTGQYEDGRVAVYQRIYVIHDPVSQTVETQQVGWDGSFFRGSIPLRTAPFRQGDMEMLDMSIHPVTGEASEIRHEITIVDERRHAVRVLVRLPGEQWRLESESDWRLQGEE